MSDAKPAPPPHPIRHRLRELVANTPQSPFDLLTSLMVLSLGAYLFAVPDLFERFGGVYHVFARWADERWWGALFAAAGAYGLVMVCHPLRPTFLPRLLARMGVAFCLVAFTINNAGNNPPPASLVTYFWLSAASVWGILRTRSDGR